MTHTLQLLTVVAVGFALACYGLAKGRKERETDQHQRNADSRQQPLSPDQKKTPGLLAR
ncbi:exported hypothetical protein [Candidatus Sulfotelmatobacter sp. SbA7]|jgi:hypothetical protein|nr:exported hypothetical protein [Candidatus Sulfotelmatobacter sp. SbA7]